MNRNVIIGIIAGLLTGFAAGFTFTNSVNRSEVEQLRADLSRAQQLAVPANAASNSDAAPPQLDSAQIRSAVARADDNPRDIYLQRNLGQMLYLYAGQTKDAGLLTDAIRLLERADRADPKNFDTLVLLGNAHFDFAQATDVRRFAAARPYYEQALRLKPDDVRVRTDLGLTYLNGQPSDSRRAIAEYEKALAVAPDSEATLQHLASAQLGAAEFEQASQTLERLRRINPNNSALDDLQAQLAGRRNAISNGSDKTN